MIGALLLSMAAIPLAPPLQEVDQAALRRRRAEHERIVVAERALELLEAWIASDEPRRAAARAVLAAGRPSRGPAVAPATIEALVGAWRELGGGGLHGPLPESLAEDQRGLQSLADSIDLTLAPGAFAARRAEGGEGRGEAVVVHVRTLFRPRSWADVELALTWIGPDGREIVARREPVETPLFQDGFPMYVRTPVSAPGAWRLVPEVSRDGRSARGTGPEVECVLDLTERAERALASEPGTEVDARVRTLLEGLIANGARGTVALAPSSMLALLERPPDEFAGPRPVERAFTLRDGSSRWVWSYRPSGAVERAIVLLAPEGQPADLALARTVGSRWRELAAEQRALLLSSELPPSGADRAIAEHLERLAALAREAGVPDSGELLLVARGDAAQRISVVRAEQLPFDAVVVSTVLRADPARFLPGLPRLVITPGGSQGPPTAADGDLTVLAGENETILNDPGLPARVAAWIRGR